MSDTLLSAGGGSFVLTGGTAFSDTGLVAGGGSFVLTGGTLTAPTRPSKDKPFIERVPEMTVHVSDRARRATEKVSVCLNSLFAQTYIEQTGQATYKIHPGAWEAARPPASTDDLSMGVQTGNIWVDTSASPRKFYVCVDNSGFSAVWNGPY